MKKTLLFLFLGLNAVACNFVSAAEAAPVVPDEDALLLADFETLATAMAASEVGEARVEPVSGDAAASHALADGTRLCRVSATDPLTHSQIKAFELTAAASIVLPVDKQGFAVVDEEDLRQLGLKEIGAAQAEDYEKFIVHHVGAGPAAVTVVRSRVPLVSVYEAAERVRPSTQAEIDRVRQELVGEVRDLKNQGRLLVAQLASGENVQSQLESVLGKLKNATSMRASLKRDAEDLKA